MTRYRGWRTEVTCLPWLRVPVPSPAWRTPPLATSRPVATSGGHATVHGSLVGALLRAVQASCSAPFGEKGKLSPVNTYSDLPDPVTRTRPNLLAVGVTAPAAPAAAPPAMGARPPLAGVAAAVARAAGPPGRRGGIPTPLAVT